MPLGRDNTPLETKPVQWLPNSAVCRAKRSGIGDVVYCLVPAPYSCAYAERCGLLTFCLHPASDKFGGYVE